jgi:hypothetical protein
MKVDSNLRKVLRWAPRILCTGMVACALSSWSFAQQRSHNLGSDGESEFGPVMRAYLGYLRNEQDVVDDRVSRREVTLAYRRRNSNRIHALRQIATGLVRESGNDYVPELEAVAPGELRTLFENPPRLAGLRTNDVVDNKFRFLGLVRAGEPFYVFARLDPYEQAALMEKQNGDSLRPKTADTSGVRNPNGQRIGQPSTTRPRRAVPR